MVIDTSVLVAGLRSRRGASFQVLRRLADSVFVPLLSVPLLFEYESILKRPEQRQITGLSIADVDDFLALWCQRAEPVKLHYLWRPQLRDSADEMVLETAVNGRADAIVTHNLSDFQPAVQRFGLDLWSPAELLRRLSERS